jgi:Zn-dependent protease
MTPTRQGSIRLFRLAGIELYLHWSWFLVAFYEINQRANHYTSLTWNVLEYLSLFVLVLLHEFGHSLACRQVGGIADHIVLWPLGGVAYVQPPQRPGAMLWSIAAGPLVNVVLIPVFLLAARLMIAVGLAKTAPDAVELVVQMAVINGVLLIFNLLPIYPLDGGQILRSLLWYLFGRAWSLVVATVLGFIGVAALIVLALATRSWWTGVMAAFILLNCWGGLRYGLQLARIARAPRRAGLACPACGASPPDGAFWTCGRCGKQFDFFQHLAVCPHCGTAYGRVLCLECGMVAPPATWNPHESGPDSSPSG